MLALRRMHFKQELKMKTRNRNSKTNEKRSRGNSASEQNLSDAADFHADRIAEKRNTARIRQFANKLSSNDELEQTIAKNVALDRLRKILC